MYHTIVIQQDRRRRRRSTNWLFNRIFKYRSAVITQIDLFPMLDRAWCSQNGNNRRRADGQTMYFV